MIDGRKVFFFVVMLTLCTSSVFITFNTHDSPEQTLKLKTHGLEEIYPRLSIIKEVDKTTVALGESFVVTVRIHNFGNDTAYNVTYIDEINNPWIFEVFGLTKLAYSQIEANGTREFSYLIRTQAIGQYSLYSARCEYYTSGLHPVKFTTFSNQVDIEVIEVPIDLSLNNFYVAITFLIVLIILDFLLVLRLFAPKINRQVNNV
ncbi:MAG: BatD family protein [Candidatus Hodarchaeales archaeon]